MGYKVGNPAALLAPRGWGCVLGSRRLGLPSRTPSLILGPSEISVLGQAGVSPTAERAGCPPPSSFRLWVPGLEGVAARAAAQHPLQPAPLGFDEEAGDGALGMCVQGGCWGGALPPAARLPPLMSAGGDSWCVGYGSSEQTDVHGSTTLSSAPT